jgi:hypothetical protein
MTSASSPRSVSALRARMIEDMTVRGFTEETHSNYIREVRGVRGLHSPPSRYGDGGGSAPLPAAPDAERHAAAEHQQFGLSAAFLFHRDTPYMPAAARSRRS